jgi:hypothetical protein
MPVNYVGQFVFISAHGRLLQAHTDGEMHASQEVQNAGEEERWLVYVWPDGPISLQNYRTKLWLAAEPNGRAICNRTAPASWEQWRLYAGGYHTTVCLRSFHSKWLCAQPPANDTQFGGEVIADRENAGPWERFSMIPSEGQPINNQTWWNFVADAARAAEVIIPIIL